MSWGQPGLHIETLLQKEKEKEKGEEKRMEREGGMRGEERKRGEGGREEEEGEGEEGRRRKRKIRTRASVVQWKQRGQKCCRPKVGRSRPQVKEGMWVASGSWKIWEMDSPLGIPGSQLTLDSVSEGLRPQRGGIEYIVRVTSSRPHSLQQREVPCSLGGFGPLRFLELEIRHPCDEYPRLSTSARNLRTPHLNES